LEGEGYGSAEQLVSDYSVDLVVSCLFAPFQPTNLVKEISIHLLVSEAGVSLFGFQSLIYFMVQVRLIISFNLNVKGGTVG